jgi:pimeloyl-ACP methyl ester carboxylesterase
MTRETGSTTFDFAISRRDLVQSATVLGAALVPVAQAAAAFAGADLGLAPFTIAVPQGELDDLKRRLDATRWPDAGTVKDDSQGPQIASVRTLVDYWRDHYDWRRLERRLNSYPQYKTEIDGLGIHFLHIRSKHANARPLIMTHGWPGSIVEFLETIDPLVNPTAHGGKPSDAFHLVLPSIPGYGFSDKPTTRGWGRTRIAHAWDQLMKRLGYGRYFAQGGDWGSVITTEMARLKVPGLAGMHVNLPFVLPQPLPENPTPEEKVAIDQYARFGADGGAYFAIQATRPQTIGYALADSPVGQAAWIYEKLAAWSDSNGDATSVFSLDQILDDIMFYWITDSAASAARMYLENSDQNFGAIPVDIPTAVSIFPHEIYTPPRAWAEKTYSKLVYWKRTAKGGHFAAFEQPAIFVNELRAGFAEMRLK